MAPDNGHSDQGPPPSRVGRILITYDPDNDLQQLNYRLEGAMTPIQAIAFLELAKDRMKELARRPPKVTPVDLVGFNPRRLPG